MRHRHHQQCSQHKKVLPVLMSIIKSCLLQLQHHIHAILVILPSRERRSRSWGCNSSASFGTPLDRHILLEACVTMTIPYSSPPPRRPRRRPRRSLISRRRGPSRRPPPSSSESPLPRNLRMSLTSIIHMDGGSAVSTARQLRECSRYYK